MIRAIRKLLLWAGFISLLSAAWGQTAAPSLSFARYGVEDGLSQVSVNALLQDNQGFLWVGTNQGLNRYDGYTFRQYRQDGQHGPSHDHIQALHQDQAGLIWVGTANGLSCYDPRRDAWHHFRYAAADSSGLVHYDVYSLFEDRQQRLWIGTGVGFCQLIRAGSDPANWTFQQWKPQAGPESHMGPGVSVHAFAQDSLGDLWLAMTSRVEDGTPRGDGVLLRFSPEAQTFHLYDEAKSGLPDREVRALLLDRQHRLWLGGTQAGLMRLTHADPPAFESYPIGGQGGLAHGMVMTLYEDSQGSLWIGSYGGLSCLPQGKGSVFTSYQWPDPQGIPQDFGAVKAVVQDRSGVLWVGAEKGLFKGLRIDNSFHQLSPQSPPGQQLIGGDIFGILAHSSGEVWAGSYQAGLNRLQPQPDGSIQVERIAPGAGPEQIPISTILDLQEDAQGHIWVSSFEGLLRIIPARISGEARTYQHFRHEPGNPHSLASNYLYRALPVGDEIWIANYTGGLEIMRPSGDTWTMRRITTRDRTDAYGLASNQFSHLDRDPQGNIWLASQGYQRFFGDPEGQWGFRHLLIDARDRQREFLPTFLYMYREEGGRIWLGSKSGLWRVDLLPGAELAPWEGDSIPPLLEAEVRVFTTADGLPSQTVYAIIPDEQGRLWLSTQKGLSRFDPTTGQFRNYDARDGLADDEFNGNAVAKDQRGFLYFGGINGLTYFHPDSLRENQHAPSVAITAIHLFNEPLRPWGTIPQSEVRLTEAAPFVQELALSHRDYVISFEFAALDFTQPEKNQYAYQMEGLDDDWVAAGNRRYVTYTNLAPGTYTFRVRASNNDGIWNEAGTALRIVVAPPWWRRWWAYLLYAGLLAGAVALLIRTRTRKVRQEMRLQARLEQAKVEERERVRAQSSRDFHDEAGNHITKISLYTGLVRRGLDQSSDLNAYLTQVEGNLEALSRGMKDFIWVLDPQKDSLEEIVQRVVDFGHSLFQDSEIEFLPDIDLPGSGALPLDVTSKRNLLMICKEAMNNALKYAQAATVRLKVSVSAGVLQLDLMDDGLGFERDKLVRVNGLNNMRKRAEEMGATLQIDATPGVGTRLHLQKEINPNG